MAKNRVWVCRKCKNADCLTAFLDGSAGPKVKLVGCQKICKGPVAGIRIGSTIEWFSRVDRAKPMVALLRTATRQKNTKLPKALRERRVRRRSGQLR